MAEDGSEAPQWQWRILPQCLGSGTLGSETESPTWILRRQLSGPLSQTAFCRGRAGRSGFRNVCAIPESAPPFAWHAAPGSYGLHILGINRCSSTGPCKSGVIAVAVLPSVHETPACRCPNCGTSLLHRQTTTSGLTTSLREPPSSTECVMALREPCQTTSGSAWPGVISLSEDETAQEGRGLP